MPKNINKNNVSLFAPKNITFGNILTQKYRTYLPVCACTECPPWDNDAHDDWYHQRNLQEKLRVAGQEKLRALEQKCHHQSLKISVLLAQVTIFLEHILQKRDKNQSLADFLQSGQKYSRKHWKCYLTIKIWNFRFYWHKLLSFCDIGY